MKREGLVLDDRLTTSGEAQFLAVKFPFALVTVNGCQYRKYQKNTKNTKKPRNNTKTTNHNSRIHRGTIEALRTKGK